MGSNTDLVLLLVAVVAVFRGWRTGLLRTLIAPASFVIGIIFGVIYFDLNENFIKTVFVILITSFVISLVTNISISLARRTMNEKQRSYVFIGSRISGMATNVTWQCIVYSFAIILLAIMPGTIGGIRGLQEDIRKSATFSYVQILIVDRVPILRNVVSTVEVLSDPVGMMYVEETDEYQALMKEKRIQDILLDENTMVQIYNKDIVSLVGNPRIKAVLDDETLMIKFTKLSKKVYEERSLIQPTDEDFPFEDSETAEENQ